MVQILLLLSFTGFQFPFSHFNVCRGYGDWNGDGPDGLEFHTGIDFRCDSTEWVVNPYWDSLDPAYVLASYGPDSLGSWVVFLVTDPDYETGWAYEHMRHEDNISDQYDVGSVFTDSVGRCVDHPDGRHLHMTWMDLYNWLNPVGGLIPQPGYFNPFDSLPVPAGYDEAMFDVVTMSKLVSSPDSTRGIWFIPDELENQFEFPGGIDSLKAFQQGVWGPVDAVVKAFSAYQGYPMNDSCGVRSITLRLFRRDSHSQDLIPIGEYEERTLFDMTGYLPDGCAGCPPEFQYVFFGDAWEDHYDNNYTITNCGCDDVSDICLANVWTSGYNRQADWLDGQYCQGAWDTRLWKPGIPGSPYDHMALDNSQALFPDGEYVFEVTAESQGSRDQTTAFLPASDISNPTLLNASSVVVDNYAPYVVSAVAYMPSDSAGMLYLGGWGTFPNGERIYNRICYGYPLDGAFRLAVQYSEPIVPLKNDVMVAIVCGSDTVWSSRSPSANWFIPTDWDPCLGSYPTGGTGFWQCYRMRNPVLFPLGYNGRIVLGFGELDGPSGPEGPFDLAGNRLDADPDTDALRDPSTGSWIGGSANYEDGLDTSHSWGEVIGYIRRTESSFTGAIYVDSMSNSGRFDVTIPSMLYDDIDDGDCLFCSGFWMYRQDTDSDILRCTVVRPNGINMGICDITNIPTLYPDIGFPMGGGYASECTMRLNTERHHWFCIDNTTVHTSDGTGLGRGQGYNIGTVVCVDCEDGVVLNARVFEGAAGEAPYGVLFVPVFESIELVSDSSDMVEITYLVPSGYPYMDTLVTYLSPTASDCLVEPASVESTRNLDCIHETHCSPTVRVSENPTAGDIEAIATDVPDDQLTMYLFDLYGRLVGMQESFRESGGSRSYTLSTNGLPNGVYMLQAIGSDAVYRLKVVVSR